MENSPTGESVETTGAQITGPTGQEQQQQPAEQTQETISREQSQEAVSDDTANQPTQAQTQTQQTGGDSQTDDGLAKFAKSQGIEDITQLDETAQRLLKVAHDNHAAVLAKRGEDGKKITDTTKSLGGTDTEARLAQLEYERETDKFWSQDGHDKSLEPVMVEILNEKAETYGKEYAFQLSRDLDTLHGMAQLRNGGAQQPVDAEAIRREERESFKKQSVASDTPAHATTGHVASPQQVTEAWLENEYDPSNPEHVRMADAYFSGQ